VHRIVLNATPEKRIEKRTLSESKTPGASKAPNPNDKQGA